MIVTEREIILLRFVQTREHTKNHATDTQDENLKTKKIWAWWCASAVQVIWEAEARESFSTGARIKPGQHSNTSFQKSK